MGITRLLISIRVGFFLGYRDIRQSSIWKNALIIIIMILTFLNLVVVRGILIGLVAGSELQFREHVTGDILVSPYDTDTDIENSLYIANLLNNIPYIEAVSGRYVGNAVLEANYKTKTNATEEGNTASGILIGIDPDDENAVSKTSSFIIQGAFIDNWDVDKVAIGKNLLAEFNPENEGLKDVVVGTTIRMTVGTNVREVVVKGILGGKVETITRGIYVPQATARLLLGKQNYTYDEILVRIQQEYSPDQIKSLLLANDIDTYGQVETWQESQPKFVQDIAQTFAVLGNIIGSIGLAVASITIFIIIFVNALTQRKIIGILKGIGIDSFAIISAYVFQAVFYALVGSVFSVIIIYAFLVPYIQKHPIDFPFSDGILVAEPESVLIRALLLYITTIIAGYIPARMIVNKNTLDSILGR